MRPTKCVTCFRVPFTPKTVSSPPRSEPNTTVVGNRIGLWNSTWTVNDAGRRLCKAARHRALVHMPCAMFDENPKALALHGWRWIGFRSPETDAYLRPRSRARCQCTTPSGACMPASGGDSRSEEHTSELQSRFDLV